MKTQQAMHGHFRQASGTIQEKYGDITDDDVQQAEGNLEKLIGLVQQKTGESREQIEACVSGLTDRVRAGYDASTNLVAERPAESVLGAFAIGMAAGVILGLSIAASRRPEPSWRNAWQG